MWYVVDTVVTVLLTYLAIIAIASIKRKAAAKRNASQTPTNK